MLSSGVLGGGHCEFFPFERRGSLKRFECWFVLIATWAAFSRARFHSAKRTKIASLLAWRTDGAAASKGYVT